MRTLFGIAVLVVAGCAGSPDNGSDEASSGGGQAHVGSGGSSGGGGNAGAGGAKSTGGGGGNQQSTGGAAGKGGTSGAGGHAGTSAGGGGGHAGTSTGGSGGGSYHVGSCDALPATGTWDAASIAPVSAPADEPSYEHDGKSEVVVADPFDAGTVWLGTGNRGLFKSTDCGAKWTKVNTGTNGASLDQGSIWSMVIDPVNQGVIYALSAYGAEGLWKSTNSGVDWAQLLPSGSRFATLVPYNFVNNVSMDAADSKHLVVMSHGACNNPYPNGCIAESFDGGATWPNIASMPNAWGEKGGVQIINATTWIWGGGDGGTGLYVTTDNGRNWAHAAGDGAGEFSTEPLEPASDGAYYVAGRQGVLRSTDGVAWSRPWAQKNLQNPLTLGIALSATTIYASENNTLYAAPISDYANWSATPGPPANNDHAEFLAYDDAHHVLYMSCFGGGLFRFGTK